MSIWLDIPQAEISTIAVYVTALSCLLLVIRLSLPLNALRTAMLLVSTAGLTIAFIFFGCLFNLCFCEFRNNIILYATIFITDIMNLKLSRRVIIVILT